MKRIIKQILISILVIFLIVLGYFVFTVARNLGQINSGGSEEIPLDLTKNVNILLLGTDQRIKDEPSRSDTIILVNINPETKKINMISIPRDTRVNIPGHGYDKINSAFNSLYFEDGGVNLTIKSVESLMGLPEGSIKYFAIANFEGFEKVIDAIGGVTIEVEKRMVYYSNEGDVVIDLKPGVQHLDGEKALEYARYRNDGYGDFAVDEKGNVYGRIPRQQKLIKAIIDQTKDLRTLWKFPAISKAVGEALDTNLTPSQITKLALMLKDTTSADLNVVPFPGVADFVDSISYVIPELDKLQGIGKDYFSIEEAGS